MCIVLVHELLKNGMQVTGVKIKNMWSPSTIHVTGAVFFFPLKGENGGLRGRGFSPLLVPTTHSNPRSSFRPPAHHRTLFCDYWIEEGQCDNEEDGAVREKEREPAAANLK